MCSIVYTLYMHGSHGLARGNWNWEVSRPDTDSMMRFVSGWFAVSECYCLFVPVLVNLLTKPEVLVSCH